MAFELSNLASQNVKIDTLFINEGFFVKILIP
jgi:hypothetical protein